MFGTDIPLFWMGVGFLGQLVFTARFVVQWIASERKGESVVPIAFWYLSLCGCWILLVYACYRRDPVIITGQLPGVVIYARNLVLIYRKRAREKLAATAPAATSSVLELPAISVPLKKAG